MNETISSRGGETSGENTSNGNSEWESVKDVPFRGGKSEANAKESDDYYTFEGEEYRNVDKIDISTEQGKYEWLDAMLENGITRKESELEDAKSNGYEAGDEIMDNLNAELSLDRRQQKILTERIDAGGDGGVVGALQREYVASLKNLSDMQERGATQNAIDMAYERYRATKNLLGLIEGEMSRREVTNPTSVEDEKVGAVDISPKIEGLRADIAKREAALEVLKSYDQRDYGDAVMAATLRLADRKKDFDLLERMLKRNDYDAEMTGEDAQKILGEMVENRDKVLATIDKNLEGVEKGSEEWKKLKADRRDAYRRVPDESVERVLKEVFNLGDED